MEKLRLIDYYINSLYFIYEIYVFLVLGGMYDNGIFFVECVILFIINVLVDLFLFSVFLVSFDYSFRFCFLIFENKDWKFELCSF